MSDFIYLTYEQVVALNERHCGEGAGVRDEAGIRAQLGRAEASFGGIDLYPTVWEKSAVLLHGLSSTQFFHDGNKRTAWLTAALFLAVNDSMLKDVADVQAEALVLSIATRAFETEENTERGIEKAAEWYETQRLTMRDRYHFAFLAQSADYSTPGANTFDARFGLLDSIVMSALPAAIELQLVMHLTWHPTDANRTILWRAYVEEPGNRGARFFCPTAEQIALYGEDLESLPLEELGDVVWNSSVVPPAHGHPHYPAGQMVPHLVVLPLPLIAFDEGTVWIRVEAFGEVITRLPLTITKSELVGNGSA